MKNFLLINKLLKNNRKNANAGFTLIEMICVISIIASLVSMIAPMLTEYLNQANGTRRDAMAKTIYTAAVARQTDYMIGTEATSLVNTGNAAKKTLYSNSEGKSISEIAPWILNYCDKAEIENAEEEIKEIWCDFYSGMPQLLKITFADGGIAYYPKTESGEEEQGGGETPEDEEDKIEVAGVAELADWEYDNETEEGKILLTKYKGASNDVIVYGAYEVNGVQYSTVLDSTSDRNRPFYDRRDNLESITIKEGVTSTTTAYMFKGCKSLTALNLDGFDTSNVTNMRYMFYGCTSLTALDLTGFNTSNVTNMSNMFYNCFSLTTLNLAGFDTSKVTDMRNMFENCASLTELNLARFDTSNVTNMYYMFGKCTSLTTLYLAGFDTSKVTDMRYMFYSCKNLLEITASAELWTPTSNNSDMFYDCGCSEITFE